MKKKLLALLLSGAMILSLTTPVALAEEPEGECCGTCGQVECVCPPEEAPCEVCGEIECECEKIEEPEVPEAPEIPEEPTVCEICGEIECECEKIEEPEVPEVPEEPTNDYAELYEALMNAESIEEFDAILGELTEEEVLAFAESLTDEEFAALDEVFAELEANAEQEEEEEIEEEDTREMVYHVPTVDFTDAAPFLDPVEGVAPRARMMFAAPRAAAAAETKKNAEGLETDKYVDPAEEGQEGDYVLTLESWATGAKTTTTQETNIPTDIVLVLDQSGSMDNSFTSTAYRAYTNKTPQQLYNNRNNLYVKLADSVYSPVNVTTATVPTGTYTSYSGQDNRDYWSDRGELYHKCGENQYGKVTMTRSGGGWFSDYSYTYSCANGCSGLGSSSGAGTRPSFHNTLYRADTTTQYTFTYEKADGTTETATVLDSESAPAWDFYESYASGNTTTRLAALKTAVTTFANQVATKAKGTDGVLGTEDDVNHRIAVVGFGRANYSTAYLNTEVFIGATEYKYGTAAQGKYSTAFQDMNKTAGVTNVYASIGALAAKGGTYVDLGLEMANGILSANPVPSKEKRNRVVIVFTDGAPGYDGSWSTSSWIDYGESGDAYIVADAAIDEAYITKNTHKATVYTVGIFEGANATVPVESNASNANKFMHYVSSNFANATSMSSTGTATYPDNGSYYLSASDSSALNSIFRTISENIENGGSSITLGKDAVVKDVITDQFVLPDGTKPEDINVYTADYTAADTFTNKTLYNAEVDFGEDDQGRTTVSVTNFDFADNWVGTETDADGDVTYRGKKLIIEIPIEVRDGFLGGNGVLTNADGSGVYENADANTSLEDFESPKVDVAIGAVVVNPAEKNVYLSGSLTASQLQSGLKVSVGGVALDMNANNYGLADWQNAYVDIENGDLSALQNLSGDTTYSVTVAVEPIYSGTVNAVSGRGTGKVNVFKPYVTVTATDIWADYGVGVDLTKWGLATKDSDVLDMTTEWKNSAGQLSTAEGVKMTGDAPAIEEATFTFDIGTDGIYKTTEANVDVNVTGMTCTVGSITGYTPGLTVVQAGGDQDNHDFTIYINQFEMTITKSVGKSEEIYHQDFIFDVVSVTGEKFQVVIHGNGEKKIKGLICGKTYDVYENGKWSWRYSAVGNEGKVENVTFNNNPNVSNTNPGTGSKAVAFENKQNIFTWLSGNDFLNNRKKKGEV